MQRLERRWELNWRGGKKKSSQRSCCASSAPLANQQIPLISPLALNTFRIFIQFLFSSAHAECSDVLTMAVQPELHLSLKMSGGKRMELELISQEETKFLMWPEHLQVKQTWLAHLLRVAEMSKHNTKP